MRPGTLQPAHVRFTTLVGGLTLAVSACATAITPTPEPTASPTALIEVCDRAFSQFTGTDATFAWDKPGGELWVSFTPGDGHWQLTQYLLNIFSDPAPFELRVYDSQSDLIFSKTVQPKGTGWQTIDLLAEEVTVDGDFFLGIYYLKPNAPFLGVVSGPSSRTWTIDPSGVLRTMTEQSSMAGFSDGEIGLGACYIPQR